MLNDIIIIKNRKNKNKLKGDDFDIFPKLYPNLYKLKISFNQINSLDNLSCLNQLVLKKIEVKENPFTKMMQNIEIKYIK